MSRTEKKSLEIESNVSFRINPNTTRVNILESVGPQYRSDDSELVDIVEFNVKDTAINGSVDVVSLDLYVEGKHTVRMPTGDAHPIGFNVSLYGMTNEHIEDDLIGFSIEYGESRYKGLVAYDEPVGWVGNWSDSLGETVQLAFPQHEVPNVVFTLHLSPSTINAE